MATTESTSWLDIIPAIPLTRGDRIQWGPSRATVTRIRPGNVPFEHVDIAYDSGRRDTVDSWIAWPDRPRLLLNERAACIRALTVWLDAAARGEAVPRINVHDAIVARILCDAATDADRVALARALVEVSP